MKIKHVWYTWALSLLSLAFLLLVIAVTQIGRASFSWVPDAEPFILIDPGHGGEDGGACASDGTLEKDINLAISLPLRDMLTCFGYSVKMTRTTDTAIYGQDAQSIRNKKVSDMKNRLELYNQSMLAIGIHQNHFPVAKYCGTQVFYSTNHPASQSVANCIRTRVIEMVQPENKRELKKSTKDIFLLDKTTVPAVLVECGFLSNEAELKNLKDSAYQQKMAFAIFCGIAEFAP